MEIINFYSRSFFLLYQIIYLYLLSSVQQLLQRCRNPVTESVFFLLHLSSPAFGIPTSLLKRKQRKMSFERKEKNAVHIQKLEDAAAFDSLLLESQTKLIVIDCHLDWCGVCDAMLPSFTRVYQEYDMASSRIKFASASIGKLGPQIQATFPSDTLVNLEKNGCLPVFAVYRFKTCVSVIVGVDGPLLLQQIAVNIPDKPTPQTAADS